MLDVCLEHLGQIREVLAAWRRHYLAWAAAQRAELLLLFVGLDEGELNTATVFDDYTPRELLAHIAAWDELFAERIELLLAGREAEIVSVELAERNARLHREHAQLSLEESLGRFMEARQRVLAALERVTDEELFRPRTLPWGDTSTIQEWSLWRIRHDAGHAEDMARLPRPERPQEGSGRVLRAALQASRDEVAALVGLVPAAERDSRPVTDDGWTLKDIIGHIADWEAFGIAGLDQGVLPDMGYGGDTDQWNAAHWMARREQPWEEVWTDFEHVRRDFVARFEGLTDEELAVTLENRWGRDPSRYYWILGYLEHERENALWLRQRLMPHLPEHLLGAGGVPAGIHGDTG